MANVHVNKYKHINENDHVKHFGHMRLGEAAMKEGKGYVFEEKCLYCGKWSTYSQKDIPTLMVKGQWDFTKKRRKYCGASQCSDFVEQESYWERKRAEAKANETQKQFLSLLKKGIIS